MGMVVTPRTSTFQNFAYIFSVDVVYPQVADDESYDVACLE